MLLDPKTLTAIVPGCHGIEIYDTVRPKSFGVEPVTGNQRDIAPVDLRPPRSSDALAPGVVVGALTDQAGCRPHFA